MTSVLLKYILEHHLPQCNVDLNLKSVHCSEQHIVLRVYLQYNRSGVDFLLYRESQHLPQIDFNCEIGLLASIEHALINLL